MRLPGPLSHTVTGEIVIRRPIADVYGFYRDFTNVPHIVGDVTAVRALTDTTYRWTVTGPLGIHLPMTVTITDQQPDRLLRYQTRGPLPARWRLDFFPDADTAGTRVREQLDLPLGQLAGAALALIGKHPAGEVTDNLARLKRVLETTPGTDTPSTQSPDEGRGSLQ